MDDLGLDDLDLEDLCFFRKYIYIFFIYWIHKQKLIFRTENIFV